MAFNYKKLKNLSYYVTLYLTILVLNGCSNEASKLVPPDLMVITKCLEPPSSNWLELLLTVLETIPPTKLSGDGLEVGLLVPVASLNVLPDEPETLML